MTPDQLGKELLMDRDLAAFKFCEFTNVVVHQGDVVADFGKARSRYQSHISRSHNRDAHLVSEFFLEMSLTK
jgi:hypothetical protein